MQWLFFHDLFSPQYPHTYPFMQTLNLLLYTPSQKDLSKNILDSIKSGHGVKVFSGFLGDKNKIPPNQLALTAPPTAISEAPSTAETADSAPASSADPIFPP
jgi:hypothetical protein